MPLCCPEISTVEPLGVVSLTGRSSWTPPVVALFSRKGLLDTWFLTFISMGGAT